MKHRGFGTSLILSLALLAGVWCGAAGSAHAVPATLSFHGRVTAVWDPQHRLDASVTAAGGGASIEGWYTYDTTATDQNPMAAADYLYHRAPYGGTVRIGSYTLASAGSATVGVLNDEPGLTPCDSYTFETASQPLFPGDTATFHWSLADGTGRALVSTVLPVTLADLTRKWTSQTWVFQERAGGEILYSISGVIDGFGSAAFAPGSPSAFAPVAVATDPPALLGGTLTTLTVTLGTPAPAGGAVVTLSSNTTPAVVVPSTVSVAPGATAASLVLAPRAVTAVTNVAITAKYLGATGVGLVTLLPPGPTALAITPTSRTSVALSWSAGAGPVLRYEIERRLGSGAYATLGTVDPGVTTFADAGLALDTFYTYRVRAVTTGDPSFSNEVRAGGRPGIWFQPPISYDTGAVSVCVADWDNDGKQDVAIPGAIRYGNGDGTLAPGVAYPVDSAGYQSEIVAADVSGDGLPDLLTNLYTRNEIVVFINLGQRRFAPPVAYVVGSGPRGFVARDFNGDGRLDLAVANWGGKNMAVLLNRGNGEFLAPAFYLCTGYPGDIASADFNGDGKADLALAQSLITNDVTLFLGDGAGQFVATGKYAVGSNPEWSLADDFNGDGLPDLATTNNGTGNVTLLLGDGQGHFGAALPYGVTTALSGLVSADLDGDGDPDLAVGRMFNDYGFYVLENRGLGRFAAPVKFMTGWMYPRALSAGDLNGDGRPDIVAAHNGGLSVFLNASSSLLPGIRSLTLAPDAVVGGGKSVLTVTLDQPAGPAGLLVKLTSGVPAAAKTSSTLTVPAGATQAKIGVVTYAVSAATPASFIAETGSRARVATLTVLPVPPPPPPPPDPMLAPADLSACCMTHTSVELHWTDRSTAETGFEIERRLGSGPFQRVATTGANANLAVDSQGLIVGAASTYRVRAVKAGVASAYSNEVNATPLPPVLQTFLAPNTTFIGGKAVPVSLGLDWPAPAAGVVVTLTSSNPAVAPVPASVTVPGSELGLALAVTTYPVAVKTKVFLTAKYGGKTLTTPVYVGPLPYPPAPSGLAVSAPAFTTLALIWTDNSSNETGFAIERRTANSSFQPLATVAPNTQSYTDTGLLGGTLYAYRVRALGSGTPSPYGSEASATTLPVNIATLGISPSSVRGGTSATATLTLDGPAPAGGVVCSVGNDSPAVATVAENVTVPAGAQSVTFTVATKAVSQATTVRLEVRYGIRYGLEGKSATLTVTP